MIISINLITENCDCVSIPRDCIEYIGMRDITNSLYSLREDSEIRQQCAGQFQLVLNKKADKCKFEMLDEMQMKEAGYKGLFDVITKNYDNLCAIHMLFDDGHKEEYYLPWPDDDEYKNTYQHAKVSEDKLRITIAKK